MAYTQVPLSRGFRVSCHLFGTLQDPLVVSSQPFSHLNNPRAVCLPCPWIPGPWGSPLCPGLAHCQWKGLGLHPGLRQASGSIEQARGLRCLWAWFLYLPRAVSRVWGFLPPNMSLTF